MHPALLISILIQFVSASIAIAFVIAVVRLLLKSEHDRHLDEALKFYGDSARRSQLARDLSAQFEAKERSAETSSLI